MSSSLGFWIGFNAFIIFLLTIDLVYLHPQGKTSTGIKKNLLISGFWILLALLFNVGIYFVRGAEDAFKFLNGYLIEYALSVDNILVFIAIFTHFNIPTQHLHKVLFMGILGAIVMRTLFILVGISLVLHFHWLFYLLGSVLVYLGLQLCSPGKKEMDIERNSFFILLRKWIPLTEENQGGKFFIRKDHRLLATPLFMALLSVELVDLIFAIDSIPAILGITLDPMIAYTSNIFAILGLRSLYFTLHDSLKLFSKLQYGLGIILIFIGLKMLISDFVEIPTGIIFAIIISILGFSISYSYKNSKKNNNVCK